MYNKKSTVERSRPYHILMLLENNPYSQDIRVKREAQALAAAGYRLTVICPQPHNGKFFTQVEPNIQLYQYPLRSLGNGLFGYLWEYGYSVVMMFCLSLIVWARHNFQIIHTHNPPDILFPIVAFYKLWGKKFIFDHHDLSPEMFCVRFRKLETHWVYHVLVWCEKLTCWLADHVIATNESYKAIVMARSGVDAKDITIVRNGPDKQIMPTTPDPILRAKGEVLLGYVGIIGPQDGLDYLLRSLHKLVYELDRRNVFCVIIGKSQMIDELKALANSLGLAEYVWFTGWVNDDDLLRYLSTVDICLDPDPSNFFNDRCTMIKMMEYMALRKPIVAFDLPEHRVSAADAALYAQPNDELDFACKIAELIDNPALRERMGKIGEKRISTSFAWQLQVKHLLEAYAKLAKGFVVVTKP